MKKGSVCLNFTYTIKPFERQHHKMVKHTQTIRRQIAANCKLFDCVWQFCEVGA